MTPRPLIIDNICVFISLWGKSALRSVLLWANILHCLQYLFKTHSLQYNGVYHRTVFSMRTQRKSLPSRFLPGLLNCQDSQIKVLYRTARQGEEASEWNRQCSPQVSGVVSHRFNLSQRSRYLISTDVQGEKLINFFCDICLRGKCGNKQKKVQLFLLPGLLSLSELHWFFCWLYRQLGILLGGGARSVSCCACVCVLTDGCHCMRAGLHIHVMEAEKHSKHM